MTFRFGRSRSSKVIDFGTSRKRVCDFLLVNHGNLVLSCTVSEILQVFCTPDPTHIPHYVGVFPLDQIADVGGQSEHVP